MRRPIPDDRARLRGRKSLTNANAREIWMSSFPGQDLEGAVALVTGACGDIGAAVCAALRNAGARLVATDLRNPQQDLMADAWLPHDVTSKSAWERVIGDTSKRFGRLDCLVNNAGTSFIESIANTSIEQWRRVLAVNVESVLLGMQAALPLLTDSGKDRPGGSSVVNFGSIAALRGGQYSSAYAASKAAVTLLSKCAAKEFAALGFPIRVNTVHPGVVETGMLDSVLTRCVEMGLAPSKEAQLASWRASAPLRRTARTAEIAAGVVFLCSPAASFMTAAELVVDGGTTA